MLCIILGIHKLLYKFYPYYINNHYKYSTLGSFEALNF